jgi:hypothetical protein
VRHEYVDQHGCAGLCQLRLQFLGCDVVGDREAGRGGLGEDDAVVEMLRVQCLYRDACVCPSLQYRVFDWRWAVQVGEQGRVDIEASVLRMAEDSGWNEQAEGYGDDEVYGDGWCPACEGVDYVGGELELFCSDLLDGYWISSIDVYERV